MKLSALLLLILAAIPLTAQQASAPALSAPAKPATKLEAFEHQTGSVIVRGYTTIGSVRGPYGGTIAVEAREIFNATTGKREYGIVIETKESGRIERESRSFIDYDEIEALLKGIDYIAKVDATSSQLGSFQADYRTKGDLEVSTFSPSVAIAAQGAVMAAVTSGRAGKVAVIIELRSLAILRTVISDAKTRLEGIRGGG